MILHIAATIGGLVGAGLMWLVMYLLRERPLHRRVSTLESALGHAANVGYRLADIVSRHVDLELLHQAWEDVLSEEEATVAAEARTACCGKPMIALDDPHMRSRVMFNPYNNVVVCHSCGHIYSPMTEEEYEEQCP